MPTGSGSLGPTPRAPVASLAWRGGVLGVNLGAGQACGRTGSSTQPSQAVGSRSQGASCFSRTPGPPTFTLSWRHSTSFAWPSPLLGSQPQVLGCH